MNQIRSCLSASIERDLEPEEFEHAEREIKQMWNMMGASRRRKRKRLYTTVEVPQHLWHTLRTGAQKHMDQVMEETGCVIQVMALDKQILIQGPEERMELAKKAVQEILSSSLSFMIPMEYEVL